MYFYHCLQTLLLVGTSHMFRNGPFHTTFKPNQAKVLTEGGDLTRSASRRPSVCLDIPLFDRIAGLYNRHLISNWGMCLRWRF